MCMLMTLDVLRLSGWLNADALVPVEGLKVKEKNLSIVVTLDVSKLSGWLNADASCRVEREA